MRVAPLFRRKVNRITPTQGHRTTKDIMFYISVEDGSSEFEYCDPGRLQSAVHTLDAFRKLSGHAVTIYNDAVDDVETLAERFGEADALVLIGTHEISARFWLSYPGSD